MNYLTANEYAKRKNVNIRTIQKWAKEGRIEGARKVGRDWMIPEDIKAGAVDSATASDDNVIIQPMPILSGHFISGQAEEYMKSLATEEERKIARAEYHYFRGEATSTSCLTDDLRFSKEFNIRMSALLLHSFSSIQLQHMNDVKQDFHMMEQEVKIPKENLSEQEQLFGKYVVILSKVLLHDTQNLNNPFEDKLQLLSDGLRFFGTYIMSHYYYLKKKYHHSLGIAETALTLFGNTYPIGSIYLFLVVAMNLISLHQEEKAEQYEAIIQMVYSFSEGWRQIHNPVTSEQVTSDLSTMEFSVAMLASKGWSNKEIAKQLNVSDNTVKNLTKSVYQKLKISGRKELSQYMLK